MTGTSELQLESYSLGDGKHTCRRIRVRLKPFLAGVQWPSSMFPRLNSSEAQSCEWLALNLTACSPDQTVTTLHRAAVKQQLTATRANAQINIYIKISWSSCFLLHCCAPTWARRLNGNGTLSRSKTKLLFVRTLKMRWSSFCRFNTKATPKGERRKKKTVLIHKQSVEIGHYRAGMLWMHHIPKSIHESLYLVRRSQGGVNKALQGLKHINVSTACRRGAGSFLMPSDCLLWWRMRRSHAGWKGRRSRCRPESKQTTWRSTFSVCFKALCLPLRRR